ncbi:unnamed protein product, partial [Staurois parvus]
IECDIYQSFIIIIQYLYSTKSLLSAVHYSGGQNMRQYQGRTDHLETRELLEGPGFPWYLFHRLF